MVQLLSSQELASLGANSRGSSGANDGAGKWTYAYLANLIQKVSKWLAGSLLLLFLFFDLSNFLDLSFGWGSLLRRWKKGGGRNE